MRPSNSLNLETALRQQLKLTPEMRLRLEVLQATHLELRDIINKELEENPLLEDVIEEEESKLTTEAAQPEQREITESVEFGENKSHLDELPEDDLSNLYEYESYERGPNTHEYNPEIGKLADYRYNSVTDDRDKDLHSQLMIQLNSLSLDDEMHIAVYTLIANLDENGFLPYDMADISEKSGIKPETLQSALEILQKFEPTGVAARDTRESLLIQLKEKKMKDSLAYLMVESQLELISRQQYEKLAAIFGTSQENVRKAEKVIKSLSPYPGKNYSNENKEYIVPDIIVDEDDDGEYSVRIQGEFPELKVNTKFLNEYKKIK
jgi:RNA polymerase sigma-54 factor